MPEDASMEAVKALYERAQAEQREKDAQTAEQIAESRSIHTDGHGIAILIAAAIRQSRS